MSSRRPHVLSKVEGRGPAGICVGIISGFEAKQKPLNFTIIVPNDGKMAFVRRI